MDRKRAEIKNKILESNLDITDAAYLFRLLDRSFPARVKEVSGSVEGLIGICPGCGQAIERSCSLFHHDYLGCGQALLWEKDWYRGGEDD